MYTHYVYMCIYDNYDYAYMWLYTWTGSMYIAVFATLSQIVQLFMRPDSSDIR